MLLALCGVDQPCAPNVYNPGGLNPNGGSCIGADGVFLWNAPSAFFNVTCAWDPTHTTDECAPGGMPNNQGPFGVRTYSLIIHSAYISAHKCTERC